MRKLNKNTNKACAGCRIPDWWDINGIHASCWEINKFFSKCPCKNCLVKVVCVNRCKERSRLVHSLNGNLSEKDITSFKVKRKKKNANSSRRM